MRRTLFSLFTALAVLAGTRVARAACTYECSTRLVDRACASAEGAPLRGGTDVELIATCNATCTEAGVVASGAVSATSVPITASTGEYGGTLIETARACDGAPVYRWTAPAATGLYRLGSRELSVQGIDRSFLAAPTDEVETPRSPPRDWEDRLGFALELGAGGVGAIIDRQSFAAGGAALFGLHHVRDEIREDHGEKFSWPISQALRWCTPIGCGIPLLLLFAPADSLIGNDRGVDLRAEVLATDGGPMVRLGVQPVMRYAHGFARTGTFFGLFLPEIAFVTGGSRSDALAFAWSPYPVEFLVDRRHFAVGIEPLRAGFRVPLDGAPVAGEMRTEISFRWVR